MKNHKRLHSGHKTGNGWILAGYLPFFFCVIQLLSPSPQADELNLGLGNNGISPDNSSHFTGLRINWSDDNVTGIDGINISLWKPGYIPRAVYNGLVICLAGNNGAEINGIYATLGGRAVPESMKGVQIGLLNYAGNNPRGLKLLPIIKANF